MAAITIEISTALVRDLVASQFPQWVQYAITPVVPGGWDNRTFRLGEHMLVRLPSAAGYAAQVAKEQHWLPILAPHLPLAIPRPLASGAPTAAYPWPWSIYGWLAGETALTAPLPDPSAVARDLAAFLNALQRLDASTGPPPGEHNFFRGGPLAVYAAQTHEAIVALADEIDTAAATAYWEIAYAAPWNGPPVWVNGDVAAGNLLITGGRLSAVIDFGCMAVGDPACDLTIAWTLFRGSQREAFRAAVLCNAATWQRAWGWALWKAAITLEEHRFSDRRKADEARRVLAELFADPPRAR